MSQHVIGDLRLSLPPPRVAPSLCSTLASSSVMRNTERGNRIETQKKKAYAEIQVSHGSGENKNRLQPKENSL